MDRLACISIPGFPIQLLCKEHPEWRGYPIAVVAENKPQGKILWVNERARSLKILPGCRYAYGLSLAPELRAAQVSDALVEHGVQEVAKILRTFSPDVEPCTDVSGVFWVAASGLVRLYGTLEVWGKEIRARLHASQFESVIVVGFSKFFTYAASKSNPDQRLVVFRDKTTEREQALCVSLESMNLKSAVRDSLLRLKIETLGQFIRLPAGGVLKRFGREAYLLHQLASGKQWHPFVPIFPPSQFLHSVVLDDPEQDSNRIIFIVKRALDPLLYKLAVYHFALETLHIELILDKVQLAAEKWNFVVRPAEPTLDSRSLLRLVRIRMESNPPPSGVVEIIITIRETQATREQLTLFTKDAKRNVVAADEAFARIRAEFGNTAVVKPVLREGHLPESQYRWQPISGARIPNQALVRSSKHKSLIRYIYEHPNKIPQLSRADRGGGWMIGGNRQVNIVDSHGPFTLSGGWWIREVHRKYYFVETQDGDFLWVYYDRQRREWFLHGMVG